MKKIVYLLLIVLTTFLFAACGDRELEINLDGVSDYFEITVGEEKELDISKSLEKVIINDDVISLDENNVVKGLKAGTAYIKTLSATGKTKDKYEIIVKSGKYDGVIKEDEIGIDIISLKVGEAKLIQTINKDTVISSSSDCLRVEGKVIYGESVGIGSLTIGSELVVVLVSEAETGSDVEEKVINVSASAKETLVTVLNYKEGQNHDYSLYAFGSGVIYKIDDDTIYILTNRHVVLGHEVLYAYFEGTEDKVYCRLLAYDDMVDLAVVAVDRNKISDITKISSCKFADYSKARVGEFVMTVGSPFDFEFSGTTCLGIVSKKEVYLEEDINYDGAYDYFNKYIQVDASINSGNSGGPLFDLNGFVLGINTAKIDSSMADNIGFSIPSDVILLVLDRLENASKIKYKSLGISCYSIDMILNYDIKYDTGDFQNGVIITNVLEDSFAEKAGILKDDIITEINGVEIKTAKQLLYEFFMANIKEEKEVTLKVYRDEKYIDLKVSIEE